ncbi:MAG: phage holin family protein [Clostridia bacterium]|jgi:putative membrane protein|nr:phage holin family protein [Clostridia bacterium]
MKLFLKWLSCIAAVFLTTVIFPDYVTLSGTWQPILAAGTILWIINLFIKPVAQLLSILITILTFGIFSLIVNAAMVCFTDFILPNIKFDNFWICLFVAVIVSLLNIIITSAGAEKNID